MQAEDLILVSVDDHVVEPPDMFDGRVPAKWKDRAPRIVHNDDGTDVWVVRGQHHPQRGPQRRGRPPARGVRDRADLLRRDAPGLLRHPRAGPGHERQRRARVDVLPLLRPVLRPALRPDRGQGPRHRHAPGLQRLAHRDLVRRLPGRFIPLRHPAASGTPSSWRPRCGGWRPRAATPSRSRRTRPSSGWPSFHDAHWDPFWSACADEGTVVCLHIGSSSQLAITAPDAPFDVLIALQPVNIIQCAADLLFSPVLRKYPTCASRCPRAGSAGSRTSSSASTTSTSTTTSGRARTSATSCRARCSKSRSSPASSTTPSASRTAATSSSTTCAGSATTRTRTRRGPHAPEMAMKYLAGVPDADVNKITHENAMRLFRYDPFARRPQRAVHGRRRCGPRRPTSTCRCGPRKDRGERKQTLAADLGAHRPTRN